MNETPRKQREHSRQTARTRAGQARDDVDSVGEVHEPLAGYLSMRGMRQATAERLNEALQMVLDAMPTVLYGPSTEDLTEHEQAMLRDGGVDLDTATERDPIADGYTLL